MSIHIYSYIYRVGEVKQWSYLLICNCYCQTHLCGACLGLLDYQIILVYIELWDVSPLVLCNLHPLLHIYHYFQKLPWVAAFWDKLAIHGVLFFCLGGSPQLHFYEAWQVLLLTLSSLVCVWGYSWGVGHCSEFILACLGLGDLFSFWGLSKKSVISIMLSSVSVSMSSKVLVFFFGYGELDLGSESKFQATLASQDVALCSSFSLFSSSILKFPKEGGVINPIGGIFSLSELRQLGSSKYLGLYSCSVGLGHGPESEVTLISLFLGVKTPGSFWGNCFPSLDGFFHGQNFSVHFSVSSTSVWFPVFVLTFKIRSTVSSGKSHEKNPFLKSHREFSNLAIVI